MNKFKVGDRVKIKSEFFVEGDYHYGNEVEGVVVTEEFYVSDLCEVKWGGDTHRCLWYHERELQAVDNIPERMGSDEAYEQHKGYLEGAWKSKKIKSDGGSSSYYDLPISDKLLKAINSRNEDGKCYVKTEDLIDELFGNDFDFGTMFKSVVRGYLQTKGEGKAGNDLGYEMNKVVYYANKIKEKGCE